MYKRPPVVPGHLLGDLSLTHYSRYSHKCIRWCFSEWHADKSRWHTWTRLAVLSVSLFPWNRLARMCLCGYLLPPLLNEFRETRQLFCRCMTWSIGHVRICSQEGSILVCFEHTTRPQNSDTRKPDLTDWSNLLYFLFRPSRDNRAWLSTAAFKQITGAVVPYIAQTNHAMYVTQAFRAMYV